MICRQAEPRVMGSGGLEAPGLVRRLGKLFIVLVEAAEEVYGADEAAGGNAQNGAACGQGDGPGGLQQKQGGGHTHHQPDDRFDDLGDGGGEHIALALEEAPKGRHNADEQHTGAQETDGGPGVGLVLEPGQLAAEQGHEEAPHNAQGQEDAPGGGVNSADLIVVFQRIGLGDHPAHGHGKTGGGDHQQHIVDFVGGIKVAEALFADDGVQRNLVDGADDFDNGGCHGQQRGALEEILIALLALIRHGLPPWQRAWGWHSR